MPKAKDPVSIAQELSERLNTDHEFRVAFVKDPQAALASIGIRVTKERAVEIRESLTISLLEAAVARGGVVPFNYPWR